MGVANSLGQYVYRTSFDDLPREVIGSTKVRFLDFLGTVFDSYYRWPMGRVLKVLQAYGGKEESTVIGDGVKLPCAFAALLNAAYNLSDGSRFAGQHPAVEVVPASLAAAEARGGPKPVSGEELILAIVLGYEVMIRIGKAMYPSMPRRGFHPSAIHGTFGAAAAASKMFGLNEKTTINAISISSLLASGLQAAARAPYPTISLQTGRATESGVLAALVAQGGLQGSDDILEEGFFPAFSDEYNLDVIEKDLGHDFAILNTYLKIHSGCRYTHAPVDAVLYMKDYYNIKVEDISQIRIKNNGLAFSVLIRNPKIEREYIYSAPFAVALALVFGEVSTDRFDDGTVWTEPIQQLLNKTIEEHDPELDKEFPQKRPAILEITTKDGQIYSHRIDLPKGEPENPFSKSEIETKFHKMSYRVVNEETRNKIIDFVNTLENKSDIAELFPLLKATSQVRKSES